MMVSGDVTDTRQSVEHVLGDKNKTEDLNKDHDQRCPSLNFLLEPEPSFLGFVFLGEPELELFGFPFLGGARARAFLVFSFLGSWSQSWPSSTGQARVRADF